GARGAADGRHVGVHRADARVWPGHSYHAAMGGHSSAFLAGSGRGGARSPGGARGRHPPRAAPHLCGRANGHSRRPASSAHPARVSLRTPLETFVRQFIFCFAILRMLVSSCLAVLVGMSMPIGGIAPLVILSALAIVVAAGDGIELTHQRLVIPAWFGLVLVP